MDQQMELFESKIKQMDSLKKICNFIDLLIFYHLKNVLLITVTTVDLSTELIKFRYYFILIPIKKKKIGRR